MNRVNKRGLVTFELLGILLIPGALTVFVTYKIISKLPILNKLVLQK
jgi:hypothetical protein